MNKPRKEKKNIFIIIIFRLLLWEKRKISIFNFGIECSLYCKTKKNKYFFGKGKKYLKNKILFLSFLFEKKILLSLLLPFIKPCFS